MARSLQVQPEETASTSALLTVFLLLAAGFLLFGTVAAIGESAPPPAVDTQR